VINVAPGTLTSVRGEFMLHICIVMGLLMGKIKGKGMSVLFGTGGVVSSQAGGGMTFSQSLGYD